MQTDSPAFDNVSTKLIAAGVIAVCLLLGVAGLILPLIPGLLFLAIAAVVAARLSPKFAETLRRNDTLRGYIDRTAGFDDLPLDQKLKLAGLLCLKVVLDGVAFVVATVMRLMKAADRV